MAFLLFAAWTWRGDELSDKEVNRAEGHQGAAIFAVGTAFFLAELGDKTMLATVALATQEGWLGTWLGSTLGMVAADALAIGIGAVLGKHVHVGKQGKERQGNHGGLCSGGSPHPLAPSPVERGN